MPDMPPRTVPELFLDRVGRTPDGEAFRYPVQGGWRSLTWTETEGRVRAVSSGLRSLGVEPEQVCAILSSTRIEWVLADYGILCAGGATSTIYPSTMAEECAFILADAGAVVAFAEDAEQVAKLSSRRAELPALRHLVTFDGQGSPDGWVLTLAALEERGRAWDAAHPGAFEEHVAQVRPDALATLLYTSGTTGRPKGVELTHACWVSQSSAVQASRILDHPDVLQLFWLPLAHSFGKMIGTAQLRIGFPTAVDGRVDKIVENLGQVRPTFVCAVPRIFEKVRAKILASALDGGAVKGVVFRWALDVGLRVSRERRAGRAPGPLLAAQHALADRLVFQKLRAIFGGRLQFFVSGSAPLSRDVAEFFDALGVVILEGYGLTESSAATHANLPFARKIGTAGRALPGIETRIAGDGEVLMRGPSIMRGYRGLPEQTAEALDEDGWLHTGDIGAIDADGFLTITDRKKDLHQDLGREVRRAHRDRGEDQDRLGAGLAGAGPRRPPQLRDRAAHAGRRGAGSLGGPERPRRPGAGRALAAPGGARGAEARPQSRERHPAALREREEVHRAPPRVQRGRGGGDPLAEAEAQGDRAAPQGRPRPDVWR